MSSAPRGIDAYKLIGLAARILQKVGVPADDAKSTAEMLVDTDLRGIDSHGVNHLKLYVQGIQKGFINLSPAIKFFSHSPSTAIMEADRGFGFIVGRRAMVEAIRRAKQTGAGFVAVRNSTHIGAGACYSKMALEHGMIGIAMTQTGPLVEVMPPGSKKRAVGTNPLSVAIPADREPPFLLDMATSAVSWGKIEIAKLKGTNIPEGWAIDTEGNAITDPTTMRPGLDGLVPLGGSPQMGSFKGFGLAVMIDILCGILSGGRAGLQMENEGRGICNPSHCFFGAISIEGFLPLDAFKSAMDGVIRAYGNLPVLPGVKKVYVAGGLEAAVMEDRLSNGLPLNQKIIQDLKELSEELGVEFDLA